MPYTTRDGVTHENSYWKVIEVNLNTIEKRGQVTFNGYHDEAARDDMKQPIDQKTYVVSSDIYDTYFDTKELDKEDVNTVKNSYVLADATLEPSGQSFFHDSTDV